MDKEEGRGMGRNREKKKRGINIRKVGERKREIIRRVERQR